MVAFYVGRPGPEVNHGNGSKAMSRRAPFASDPATSRGRLVAEPESPPRTPFQRDRDRIIHSTAFRRLKHKTQVFVYHEGDHYRTRLTHSLEVAQVARSIARALGLDEDLTEALALAHDLGHTPFGHAGERELDRLMAPFGGFDHNAQTVRIVTRLERRYAAFDGLNLTWETIEGLIKHNGPLIDDKGEGTGSYCGRSLPPAIVEAAAARNIPLSGFAAAEAQAAAIADDIAYNAHDLDDGLRAGLFAVADLKDLPLAGPALTEVAASHPDLARSRLVHETVRRVISRMVEDVVAEAEAVALEQRLESPETVRALPQALVKFSPQMAENNRVLQSFLARRMYHHEKVLANMERAQRVIRDLFEAYMSDERLLPADWHEDGLADDRSGFARQVCDFIAGMTDRYAIEQHKRQFDLDRLFR
jgi:dGTPase